MKQIALFKFALALPVVCLSTLFVAAQSGGGYAVTQWVIANGGGRSADATYAIDGTVGQSAAGTVSSNGSYSFQAGFWQVFLAPTAASVSISGRVVTASGSPVRGSRVILKNLEGDFVTTSLTGSFGYYRLEGIEAGRSYLLEVAAKGLQFEPRVVSVFDEITDLELVVFQ